MARYLSLFLISSLVTAAPSAFYQNQRPLDSLPVIPPPSQPEHPSPGPGFMPLRSPPIYGHGMVSQTCHKPPQNELSLLYPDPHASYQLASSAIESFCSTQGREAISEAMEDSSDLYFSSRYTTDTDDAMERDDGDVVVSVIMQEEMCTEQGPSEPKEIDCKNAMAGIVLACDAGGMGRIRGGEIKFGCWTYSLRAQWKMRYEDPQLPDWVEGGEMADNRSKIELKL